MMQEPITADAFPVGLRVAAGRSARLRQLLAKGPMVAAPGCYDCITARLVEVSGFPAAYVTGSGVSMSALGAPDVGALSFGEILDRVRRICDSVEIPVIADADTGYGGPLNVIRTMREFERAGVSAIQIEDQEWPKKCGHEPGRRIVPAREMEGRIKAAKDAQRDADTIVIARTDARTDHGLEAALERMEHYREAGADVLFVESPQSEEEMAAITPRLKAPTLANMVEGGRTPILSRPELENLGFKLAIFPASGFLAMGAALQSVYGEILSTGSSKAWPGDMYSFNDFSRLMGFERVWAFEREHSEFSSASAPSKTDAT
jgi:2-methylisocitrate lyase-like PEP mutase family enzyme